MAGRTFCRRYQNWILTGLFLLLLLVFVGVRYDYYFDLNDDVLMKDILAGVYTGAPESRNIQMRWPISALISLLYRIAGTLPWYGIFLCLCHYGSIALIAHRSLLFCEKLWGKALLLSAEGILAAGLLLPHLVSAQYTVTSALLASTAAFLFLTTDRSAGAKGEGASEGERGGALVKTFIRSNIPAVLLVILAFLVRPWMLLLQLPLICAAGVIKWGSEERIFTRDNWIKYLTVIGMILAGLALGQISHRIAYGSGSWQSFLEYFNNRTELYDFQVLPEYEEHREFFDEIGLSEGQWMLLDNYNFGLDERIDQDLLGNVADYAAAERSGGASFVGRLRESLGQYYRRLFYPPSHNESDFPWSFLLLVSYLAAFATALPGGERKFLVRFWQILWKLGFLFLVRTVLWIWLIQRGRVPVRISHSMYLTELCILAALLFEHCRALRRREEAKAYSLAAPLVLGTLYALLGALIFPSAVRQADLDTAGKARENVRYEQLYAFLGRQENKGNFYLIDVYSSVGYTEKMFEKVDNSLDNYDIMGGWACKSPLWRKKLSLFGIEDPAKALIEREDVYYVQEAGADMSWLGRYYEEMGVKISAERAEAVGDAFEIYRLRRA